jgi:hypothetical protein
MVGIKAKRIIAENVGDVQQIGGSAADAAALMKAMRGLELGDIEADEILAGNLGLFQHISSSAELTVAGLLREVRGIQAELQTAVAAGQLPAPEARQALEATRAAEAELSKPEPDKKAATDRLGKMAETIKKTAEASENIEKLGGRLVKLAPAAMALWKLAQGYLGG